MCLMPPEEVRGVVSLLNAIQHPVDVPGVFFCYMGGSMGILTDDAQTVEQYGGDMQMDWKDGVFTVRVMLTAEALTPSDLRFKMMFSSFSEV